MRTTKIALRNKTGLIKTRDGQSASEFIIVLPVLLALILGAFQFGLIYQAKATLNQAAFQVVRAGALNGGSMEKMKKEMVIWLTPLFTYESNPPAIEKGHKIAQDEVDKYVHIEQISPPPTVFKDFGDPLPNDSLMYRSTEVKHNSGMSIQDANILKVKVVYCYRLIVPFVATMIDTLAKNTANAKKYCDNRKDKNIPLTASSVMRMQSRLKP